MKLRKKALIGSALAVSLLLAVAGAFVLKNVGKMSPETLLKILPEKADVYVKNVLYREVDADAKWEIRADKAEYMKKGNQALFQKVEVKLLLPDQKTYIMKGDSGRMDTVTKDMRISGSVGIISGSGERFETNYLEYSHARKLLHTEAPVFMKTARMQIRGVGMSLSLAKREVALLSKVHARIEQ